MVTFAAFDQEIYENAALLASKLEYQIPSAKLQIVKSGQSNFHGKHNFEKPGNGSDFWQFREYRDGEPTNNVAWRESAKSDKLIIKEFEAARPFRLQFWIDNRKRMAWSSQKELGSKADFALTIGLAIIKYLRTNLEIISPLNGKLNAGHSAINIGVLRECGSRLPHKFARGTAIIIADGLDDLEDLQSIFRNAQKAKCKIFFLIIQDPGEREFDFYGNISFKQSTDDNEIIIEDCQSVAPQFRANYDRHFADIKELCRQNGVDYLQTSTKQPPLDACIAIIKALVQNRAASANL